jgi:hypothetical protein
MTRKLLMLTLLLATALVAMPADSYGGSRERTIENTYAEPGSPQKRGWDNKGRKRRRNRTRRHSYYRYKNYGQYRRTQVGNRRYRLVRRSYWRDGVRRIRLVRIYY